MAWLEGFDRLIEALDVILSSRQLSDDEGPSLGSRLQRE